MAPRVDPVRSDEALPARADVVIIGGGIIGTSAALFLAEKGVSVALCEKGHIAGEQSSRNWGWCRKMGRDPREMPLIIESLRLWQGMNERVEAETGFRQPGIMYLAETPAELGQLETWLDHARQYQLDTRLVDPRRGGGADAGADRRLGRRALHRERRQGRAAAGGAGDRRGGAAQGCRDRDPMRGARHRNRRRPGRRPWSPKRGGSPALSVVLAGGAWSRLFCGNLGIELPQLKVLASVMRTEPLAGGPEISASGGLFGFRKRMDGGYTVATLGVRTIDLVPDNFRLFRPNICRRRGCIGRNCDSGSAGAGSRSGGCSGAGHWIEATPFEAVRTLDPEPDPYRPRSRQGRRRAGLSAVPRHGRGRELGRDDRRDAGRDPGDLAG